MKFDPYNPAPFRYPQTVFDECMKTIPKIKKQTIEAKKFGLGSEVLDELTEKEKRTLWRLEKATRELKALREE